jgi:hypothetical protein
MQAKRDRRRRQLWGLVVLSLGLTPALAELAKVHLKNGIVMRGDVELSESEALIRNAAGVVCCPRAEVDRIEWLEEAATVRANYMRRFWALKPDDVGGHFELARWLVERRFFDQGREQCAYVLKLDPDHAQARLLLEKIAQQSPTTQDAPPADQDVGKPGEPGEPTSAPAVKGGLEPAPLLSDRDILRLKLSELTLDGTPERVNLRFLRARSERDLVDLVRQEMRSAPDYDPDWDGVLERGRPYEKLPVILKATGLKYADRIELRSDPEVFATYRRRVLPIVLRGCARGGCHGGADARSFRLSAGSQSSDGFVYTSFALLDEMQTAAGPMIDRTLPEDSALIRYLLPAEEGQPSHPPVEQGRVMPVLRNTRDPRYQMLVEWIDALRSPHPDYELEYVFPAWFEEPSRPADAQGEPDAIEEAPAEQTEGGDQP